MNFNKILCTFLITVFAIISSGCVSTYKDDYIIIGDITKVEDNLEKNKTTLGEFLKNITDPENTVYQQYATRYMYSTHVKATEKRVLVIQYNMTPAAGEPPLRKGCHTTKNIFLALKNDNLDLDNIIEDIEYDGATYKLDQHNEALLLLPFHERSVMPVQMNYDFGQMQRMEEAQLDGKAFSKKDFPVQSDTIEVDILQKQIELKLGDCAPLEKVDDIKVDQTDSDAKRAPYIGPYETKTNYVVVALASTLYVAVYVACLIAGENISK